MKSEILSITDYKAILRGQIEKTLGHNPSDDEIEPFEKAIADYISDCINIDKRPPYFGGVAEAIKDCRDGYFKQCVECGDYFLVSEMNPDEPDHCCECKGIYDPDTMPGGHDDLIAETWNGLFSQN